jgi:hypothetical protein
MCRTLLALLMIGPVTGSASWRVVMIIVLAALAMISWALRPPRRTLGILFPPATFRRKKEE